MSKIEKLIKELCPDGVEHKKMCEIMKNISPPKKITKNDYLTDGKYPILDQGQKFIVGYTNDEKSIMPEDEYIIFGDHTCEIKYINMSFSQGADGIKILKTVNKHNMCKFIYYAFKKLNFLPIGYQRHWNIAKDLTIPIPPLPIQEEIVRILDKFTQLEAELEAELEARKKQYEYYRNNLLSFDADFVEREYLLYNKKKRIGDFAKILYGKDYRALPEGNIPVYGTGGIINYVGRYIFNKSSIILPRKGSLKNVFYCEKHFWATDTTFYLEIDETVVRPKYLYYFLLTQKLEDLNIAGGVPSLTREDIIRIYVPIPSLETQEQIVEILDRFDMLVNDLRSGLPAEINARRKQYEYYRDKLLSFREKHI